MAPWLSSGRGVNGEDLGRTAGLGDADHPAPVAGAVAVVAAHAEDDPALVEGQARALQQRGRIWRPVGSTTCESSTWPRGGRQADQDMGGLAAGQFVGHDEDLGSCPGSMTGVPVIPTVGEMSPQGRSDDGTGVPDVRGPFDGSRGGGQCVDGVVLRGRRRPEHPKRVVGRRADPGGSETSRRAQRVSTAVTAGAVPSPAGSPW